MRQPTPRHSRWRLSDGAQARFPALAACSFDQGFHSPVNQGRRGAMLDECALPRKGKLSKAAAERESQEWFKQARRQHPAAESAINRLERCGLGRALDHGVRGFALSGRWRCRRWPPMSSVWACWLASARPSGGARAGAPRPSRQASRQPDIRSAQGRRCTLRPPAPDFSHCALVWPLLTADFSRKRLPEPGNKSFRGQCLAVK